MGWTDVRVVAFIPLPPGCGVLRHVHSSGRLLVTVAGLEPGAPLDAAVALTDALDARRVSATLLIGPAPHPEVVAWAAARRRAGDAVLLAGTRTGEQARPGRTPPERGRSSAPYRRAVSTSWTPDHRLRPYRRLPAHEAGLRLAAALRTRDALGLPVDGFAAPGWAVSDGTRRALSVAGVGVAVDDEGVHRLGAGGAVAVSCRGPVTPLPSPSRPRAPSFGRPRRRVGTDLVHLAIAGRTGHDDALARIDAALDGGAVPGVPATLVPAPPGVRRPGGDPELWSITA